MSAPAGAGLATVAAAEGAEDAVRRRQMLTGAVGVGVTAALGAPTANASPSSGTSALEDVLYRPPSAAPVPLPRLVQEAARARAAWRAAEYETLGRALPGLVAAATATRDAAAGRERDRAHVVLARSYVLTAELALKQHSDAAWAAADRALTAARASGHPVPVGEATRVLAITMRRSGGGPGAVRLLRREAADLDAGQVQTASVRTTLALTAAYTAAVGGDRSSAFDLLGEAEDETARRAAADGLFTVDATRAQVDVYRIGVCNALHLPDEGVEVVRRLDISAMPTRERRARAWTDIGRMWHQLGDDPRTLAALRRVEQEAPQEVRRPALRSLVSELLYTPARLPGIREFAARTGAAA